MHIPFPFVVPFIVRFNIGQCYVDEHGICMLIGIVFSIKAEEVAHVERLSSLYMFTRKKPQIDWKSLEGAFKKPRRLHLVKGTDGLEHCPVTGCEQAGFAGQRSCRKHVKNIHAWYFYFDTKPTIRPSPFAIAEAKEKVCKQQVPGCSTDNARFHSGFKAAAVAENLANNRIIQSQEL